MTTTFVPATGLLAGITRALLLDYLPRLGERVAERDLSVADIHRASELFLSSTLRDIGPVTHLDGRALHSGGIGQRTSALMTAVSQHFATRRTSHYAPLWRRLCGSAT